MIKLTLPDQHPSSRRIAPPDHRRSSNHISFSKPSAKEHRSSISAVLPLLQTPQPSLSSATAEFSVSSPPSHSPSHPAAPWVSIKGTHLSVLLIAPRMPLLHHPKNSCMNSAVAERALKASNKMWLSASKLYWPPEHCSFTAWWTQSVRLGALQSSHQAATQS